MDLIEKKIEDRVDVGMRVGGEELGVHVEDTAQGGPADAKGRKTVLDREERGEWRGAEIRVQLECLVGIDIKLLEVDDFLAEKEAGVGAGGGS